MKKSILTYCRMDKINLILLIISFNALGCLGISAQALKNSCNETDMQRFFLKAISEGDTVKLKQYLDYGMDINGTYCQAYSTGLSVGSARVGDRFTPLDGIGGSVGNYPIYATVPYFIKAVQAGKKEVISFFLRNGADVNRTYQVPRYGDSKFDPVYRKYSCPMTGTRRVSMLGYSYFQVLERGGTAYTVVTLQRMGAKLTESEKEWMQNNIKYYSSWQSVCPLLEKLGCVFDYNADFLYESLHNKNNLEYCLSLKKIQPDARCLIASFTDVKDIELTKRFLDMGVPVDSYYGGTTLLGYAVAAKKLDFIKYLVEERKAKVDITVSYSQQGSTFSFSNTQGMGFQKENHTVKLIDYAKKTNAGDAIIEYLVLAQFRK